MVVVVEVGGGLVLSCLSNRSLKESLNSCRFSAEMNTNSLLGPENCVICGVQMTSSYYKFHYTTNIVKYIEIQSILLLHT